MPLPIRNRPYLLLAFLASFVGSGCGGDDTIRSTNVTRATQRESRPQSADFQMLGAMFPADDPQWFFKLSGRTEHLAKYEADFDKLLASVKLPGGGKTPEFTLPDGWKRGGGRGSFVAETIKLPEHALEITITQSQGGVAGNLKRWVGQVGLISGPDDQVKYAKTVEAQGVKGLRVDLKGPTNPATKRGPMFR